MSGNGQAGGAISRMGSGRIVSRLLAGGYNKHAADALRRGGVILSEQMLRRFPVMVPKTVVLLELYMILASPAQLFRWCNAPPRTDDRPFCRRYCHYLRQRADGPAALEANGKLW
jgi:hypothetical protein